MNSCGRVYSSRTSKITPGMANINPASSTEYVGAQRRGPAFRVGPVLREQGQHQSLEAPGRAAGEHRIAVAGRDVERLAEKVFVEVGRRTGDGARHAPLPRLDREAHLVFQVVAHLPVGLG